MVHPEDDLLLEVVEEWYEDKQEGVGDGHVEQEQVGRLEPEELVLQDNDDDWDVAYQPDQGDHEQGWNEEWYQLW